MQMHNLKRNSKRITSMDVGRGGKRGKTAGRGTKGQNARAGRKFRPEMRDAIKKLPKLRGHTTTGFAISSTGVHNNKPVAINLNQLIGFVKGETVSQKTLAEKKVLNMKLGKYPQVKILGVGEIKIALNFERVNVSKDARAKIEKAGGTIKEEVKISDLKPKAERRAAKKA
jgi:large subunit ribosomal protein L15